MAATWPFTKGLHNLGNGAWAYLQPDGGWCLSNSGLITDGDQALLVDTLTDMPLTHEMLSCIDCSVPGVRIGTIVNTHSHPDHTAGNAALPGAEIIASAATAAEMGQMLKFDPIDGILKNWQEHGEAGAFLHEVMGSRFELNRVPVRQPTRVFEHSLDLKVGDKDVTLIKIGPAHTVGDVLAYVPRDRTVYAGDVLFHKVHPSIMGVAVADWVTACDRILAMDVETVVPGHGPITDKAGVRELRAYLEYVSAQARRCYDAGMTVEQAANDVSLAEYRGWADEERICATISGLYASFGAPRTPMPLVFEMMARRRRANLAACGHNH